AAAGVARLDDGAGDLPLGVRGELPRQALSAERLVEPVEDRLDGRAVAEVVRRRIVDLLRADRRRDALVALASGNGQLLDARVRLGLRLERGLAAVRRVGRAERVAGGELVLGVAVATAGVGAAILRLGQVEDAGVLDVVRRGGDGPLV